jgi:Family of unknown function (DUF6069)
MNTTAVAMQSPTSEQVEGKSRYVRAGLVAGLVAAAVNTVVVAIADAADVSFVVQDGGRPIPAMGFAQITFVSALIGIGLAAILRRHSTRPVTWFTRVTVALTAVSLVPPVVVDADTSTKVLLIVTHLIAAAIVIPVIVKRLAR